MFDGVGASRLFWADARNDSSICCLVWALQQGLMYRFRTEEADTQKMVAGVIGHRTPSGAAACWQSKFSEPTLPTSARVDAVRIRGIGRRWPAWRMCGLSHAVQQKSQSRRSPRGAHLAVVRAHNCLPPDSRSYGLISRGSHYCSRVLRLAKRFKQWFRPAVICYRILCRRHTYARPPSFD